MIKRKEYSAGAVKMSFWFMEFRKVVGLLASGKSYNEIKKLSQEENRNLTLQKMEVQKCC